VGKLPEFDDWKWPWDKGEVDEEKAARLVYNARKAEETATEKLSAEKTKVSSLESELDDAKSAQSGGDAATQQTIKDLRKKVSDLEGAEATARPEDVKQIAQLRAAVQLGLSERDSKRLVGDDFDEILADAKEFAREHGIEIEGNEGEDDEGENDGEPSPLPPVQSPRSNLRSGFQGKNTEAPSNPKEAEKFLAPLY
jgi:polyhydroxyalkanoate synthesis regulator phasin